MNQDPTRTRLVSTATRLLARSGYRGLGVSELLQEAQATSGSLYHHFPGGKQELAATAIREAGAAARDGMAALLQAMSPTEAVAAFFAVTAAGIEQSEWQLGCPVGTPAADGVTASPMVAAAVEESFASWVEVLSAALVERGVAADAAHDLAVYSVVTYEGAALLSRARRDTGVMSAAGTRLAAEFERALDA